ncbi:hypothetical protein TNCV_1295131 [Trichonephila clavipes]|nr:hypothetical protein TNCV_1295131 [Trichonephila clavipes]
MEIVGDLISPIAHLAGLILETRKSVFYATFNPKEHQPRGNHHNLHACRNSANGESHARGVLRYPENRAPGIYP